MINQKSFFPLLVLLLSLSHYSSPYNRHTPFHQHLAFDCNQQPLPNVMHIHVKNYAEPSYCIKNAMAAVMHSVEQLYIEKYPCVTLPVNAAEQLQSKKAFTPTPLPVEIDIDDAVHNECPIETKRYDTKTIEQIEKQLLECKQNHTWHNSKSIITLRCTIFEEIKQGNQKTFPFQYDISENIRTYCDTHALQSAALELFTGDALQQTIHAEFVDIVHKAAHIWRNNTATQTEKKATAIIADFVEAGVTFNQSGCINKALVLANACWTLLDCIQAVGEGVIEGVCATVDDCVHPIRTIVTIMESAKTCGYYVGKAIVEIGRLGYCTLTDSDKSREKFTTLANNCKTISTAIKKRCKKLKTRDVIKTATTLGIQWYATGRLLNGTSSLLNNAQKHATHIAQKLHYSADQVALLTTPEGIIVRVAENAVEYIQSAQKIAKKQIIVVQNMQQFFELPFGQLLAKNSIKTPYRYQNPIYKLTKDIADTKIKEGFFYYLDRLHKDHIEVFNVQYKAIAVYNLDGTLNMKKFTQSSGRSIRKFMKGK